MARTYVWMMAVVVVLAIVVAENGRACVADDNNNNDQNKEDKSVMKELHDKAESWTDWARNKISGYVRRSISFVYLIIEVLS